MRFLIVEDDAVCALVFKETLKVYGQCDVAEDGLKGVKLFSEAIDRKEGYDLICMDIMMPNMDGQTALQAIRDKEKASNINLTKRTSVLMITALKDDANIGSAFLRGAADGYLVKPVKKRELLDEVVRLGLIEI
ncbi:response regulator [bacterium]|nr:response regulator [bacterium]